MHRAEFGSSRNFSPTSHPIVTERRENAGTDDVPVGNGFRAGSLDQPFVLPPSLQDFLPENHVARRIAQRVDTMDLTAILSQCGRKHRRGKAAWRPAMPVRLPVYRYAVGVRSSRAIDGTRVADERQFDGPGIAPDGGWKQQLAPMLAQVERNLRSAPELTTADAGYWNDDEIGKLQEAERDVLVPPDGGKPREKEGIPANEPRRPVGQEMRARLQREEERKRGGMAEPAFGLLKEILGYRRFLLRGLTKVRGEWRPHVFSPRPRTSASRV
jgi:hypothetical protein